MTKEVSCLAERIARLEVATTDLKEGQNRIEGKLDKALESKADREEVKDLKSWMTKAVIGLIAMLFAITAFFIKQIFFK